jgi:hypothetical protein
VIALADIAFAQDAKDLVGTWQLVSNVIDQGGKKIDQFGPDPHGVLFFESNGRYALVIVRDDLPKFAGKGRANGTPEENKAVVQGSIAHFGRYSVSGNSIVFSVDHSTFPTGTAAYSSGRLRSGTMSCRFLSRRRLPAVEARRWPGDG